MIRDFTVQCHTTGFVTRVKIAGDHVAACRALRDRQKLQGWTYPTHPAASYTFRVREWPHGKLYEVALPAGTSKELAS